MLLTHATLDVAKPGWMRLECHLIVKRVSRFCKRWRRRSFAADRRASTLASTFKPQSSDRVRHCESLLYELRHHFSQNTSQAVPIRLPGSKSRSPKRLTVTSGCGPRRGHTPGHTSYEFSSQRQKILFWGYTIHAQRVCLQRYLRWTGGEGIDP